MSKLVIRPDGGLQFIYCDELRELLHEGTSDVIRVSHVEPTRDGGWTADMTPFGQAVLLGPFETRKEAIDAETEYIEKRL